MGNCCGCPNAGNCDEQDDDQTAPVEPSDAPEEAEAE